MGIAIRGRTLRERAADGRRALMPDSKRRLPGGAYHKDRFIHEEVGDSHMRPQGRRLTLQCCMQTDTVRERLYRTARGVCQRCPAVGVCAIGRIHGRASGTGAHEEKLLRLHALLATGKARRASRRWARLTGPVSGILEERMGMRQFALQGLVDVAAQWTLTATAFNLRILWRI